MSFRARLERIGARRLEHEATRLAAREGLGREELLTLSRRIAAGSALHGMERTLRALAEELELEPEEILEAARIGMEP